MSEALNGFIKLPRALVRGDAWQGLSPGARALMLEIWCGHNGRNNGSVRYSVRQAVESLHCSLSTAQRWFRELEDAGLIEATERGSFSWKAGARQGKATSWRIVPESGQT